MPAAVACSASFAFPRTPPVVLNPPRAERGSPASVVVALEDSPDRQLLLWPERIERVVGVNQSALECRPEPNRRGQDAGQRGLPALQHPPERERREVRREHTPGK